MHEGCSSFEEMVPPFGGVLGSHSGIPHPTLSVRVSGATSLFDALGECRL
jgi:hypothetical protein